MNRKIALSAAGAALLAPAAALAASHGQLAPLPVLKIVEAGNAITATGSLESGATEIDFSTDEAGDPTSIVLVRLKPGVTPEQAYAGIKPDGSNVEQFGSIRTTADVAKGEVVKLQTVLNPARYVAIDPGGQSGPGPTTDFTVAPSASPKALPKTDATIRMLDYKFRGPTTIKRGRLVRTVNAGDEQHMAIALKVPRKMTTKQVLTQLKKGQDKKLQKEIKTQAALIDDVSHGAVNQSILTLSKGHWVLACFMTNKKGVEHTKLGMERALTVK